MIRQRVRTGLKAARDKLARDGKFETRRGVKRTKLGRPGAHKLEAARRELAAGRRHHQNRQGTRPGVGTVHKLKQEMG